MQYLTEAVVVVESHCKKVCLKAKQIHSHMGLLIIVLLIAVLD
jgi:hypothetical protein